jgi:hypothetical protein
MTGPRARVFQTVLFHLTLEIVLRRVFSAVEQNSEEQRRDR